MRALSLAIVAMLLLVGCGDESTDTSGTTGGSTSGSYVPPDGSWQTLVTGTWKLESGREGYWCATKTVEEDLYASARNAPITPW